MPKTSTKAEFNAFVKGIITEASPLNFPENASLDEQNFEINQDGTRNRRLGMDFESGSVFRDIVNNGSLNDHLPVVFKWTDAASLPDKDFLVIQESNRLHIHDLSVQNLSSDGYVTTLTLSELPPDKEFSLSSVDGYLIVASGTPKIAIITYENNSFSIEYDRLKTRDLWGVDETIPEYDSDASYRGDFSIEHYYNLQNQSWGISRKDKNGELVDPIDYYMETYNVIPSNSEVVWTGLQYQPVNGGADPYERIYPSLYEEVLGASIKAAKGYYIIDVLDRGASRQEQFANNAVKYPDLEETSITLPVDSTKGGASVINEFSGRVFYTGFTGDIEGAMDKSPNLSNYVFFSQLVKNKKDYVKCYQEGDPTSRDNSDIVDTDGGFIRISGANRILGLVSIGSSQIVLASNGVWSITGGSDYGFSATNYRVDKLSSFGCISKRSIVSDGSRIFFWGDAGIYMVTTSEKGLQVNNLTETTIQTKYQVIDNFAKSYSSGVYDSLDKKIRWVYHTTTPFKSGNETYELVLDLIIGSFYLNRIFNVEDGIYYVVAGFDTNRYVIDYESEDIIVGSDNVVASGNQVVIQNTVKNSAIANVRYLTLKCVGSEYSFAFSYYKNIEFKDWGEVDAAAYLLTGAITATDTSAKKQVPYLIVSMKPTETGITEAGVLINQSSCKMQFVWDWTTTPRSNRWSNEQQVYRLNHTEMLRIKTTPSEPTSQVVITKTRIRGTGRAFSVLFNSEEGKDCQILGWSISLNGIPIT